MSGNPDLSFYSTAAQVIPVLFIALAIELRGATAGFLPDQLIRRRAGDAADSVGLGEAVYGLFVTLALGAGEAAAFIAMGKQDPTLLLRVLVIGALVFGGLGLVLPIVLGQIVAARRAARLLLPPSARGREIAARSAWGVALISLLTLGSALVYVLVNPDARWDVIAALALLLPALIPYLIDRLAGAPGRLTRLAHSIVRSAARRLPSDSRIAIATSGLIT